MGLLDKFKKSKDEYKKSESRREESEGRLKEANEALDKAKKEDKLLKDRFVNKVFRGKLIENVSVVAMGSGEEIVKVSGRVLSFDEYLNNSYDMLVEGDEWLSGAFAVYGGKADRKWWNSFVVSIGGYSGISADDNNVSANRLLSVSETSNAVKSMSFTRDEQKALKGIMSELGLGDRFAFADISGFVDRKVLEAAWDKIIEFIVDEADVMARDNKRWYWFNEEGSQDAFVDLIVARANNVVRLSLEN